MSKQSETLRRAWLVCCFAVYLGGLFAQSVKLQYLPSDSSWTNGLPTQFANYSALQISLKQWQEDQFQDAFWEASVDTIHQIDSLNYQAKLHRGPRYQWHQLIIDKNIPSRWLSRAGYRSRLYESRPFSHHQWLRLRDSLTAQAADNGYPFAEVSLDSIVWLGEGRLQAQLKLKKDSLIRFGALKVNEAARVNTRFLQRYLGVEEGMSYKRTALARVPSRLNRLPYLKSIGEPTISFRNNEAILDLPLSRKPASSFDFVIGVLPNNAETGKLLITGELNGALQNGLGQGERIAVKFQQLRPQTQELQLQFDYPYLLSLPFGLSLEGELYRRDTQFINLNYQVAANYHWNAGNKLDVFWSRRQTNLLGFDETLVTTRNKLPDTLDVRRSFFGLRIKRDETDQVFNPNRGYIVSFGLAAGTRTIRRNSKLLDLGLGPLYDSLNLRNAQYNLTAELAYYRSIFSGTVLYLGFQGAAYLSKEPLLANEQFRLGGAKLLRGFDEQQIFASSYGVLTTEFRLLLGQDAYLYAFGDFAYVNPRNQSQPDLSTDFPIGFGGGMSFNSRAGIFALSLALGRRSGEVIDLGAPKVHFGYLSVF